MRKLLTLICFTTFSLQSFALCTQNHNTLPDYVGLDKENGTIYATINSEQKECGCDKARFVYGRTDTKAALSILLAAKLSERAVRVDFETQGDCDSAYRVYIK